MAVSSTLSSDEHKYRTLMNICSSGNFEMFKKYFLKYEDFFTTVDEDGGDDDHFVISSVNNSFIMACSKGYLDIFLFLISYDFDYLNQERIINNGFINSCKKGHLNIVNTILKNDRLKNKLIIEEIKEAICEACLHDHNYIVLAILNENSLQNLPCGSLFITACCRGHLDIVKKLHESKRVSNKKNYEYAMKNCFLKTRKKANTDTDIIEYMLEHCKEEVEDFFYGYFAEKQIKYLTSLLDDDLKDSESYFRKFFIDRLNFLKNKLEKFQLAKKNN